MLAAVDTTVTVLLTVGGAIAGAIIAAAAPWRSAALAELDKALTWQKAQIEQQAEQIDDQAGQIATISEHQERCERERAEDRERSRVAQARNEARIADLERQLKTRPATS